MSNSERVIRQYFELQRVQYGFLLVYSPDFNPVDNSFLELKKYWLKKNACHISRLSKICHTASLDGYFIGYFIECYPAVLPTNGISKCMKMQFECVFRVLAHVYRYINIFNSSAMTIKLKWNIRIIYLLVLIN